MNASGSPVPAISRAVVIVSGGDAISPFTTPTQACSTGLAAGSTDTALRESLLAQGHVVFTSPAMNARGRVIEQPTGFGAFAGMPFDLPDHMTVNATGDIDLAGEHLARFLGYLHSDWGVQSVDIVAHSMGGLFSRAAMRVLKETSSAVAVRSLVTLGTPWTGSIVGDYVVGDATLADCAGNEFMETVVEEFKKRADSIPVGAAQQVTTRYLTGAAGWNAFQRGVLDDVPVTLIGGSYFEAAGPAHYWPGDGLVSVSSAHAEGVPDEVLPHRRTLTFPLTHSTFISDAAGLDESTAMTWNVEVLAAVDDALRSVD